ncbi:FAD binding domain-containing protein [Diplogelasinospora grovesii]|uniref:FAD binding domain-containing protein n=1 Tax=Diplogelasinospora grovesii TaxID=303347 RepID=A0AAN6S0E1_9PEZI|nr:FAD binding domain-containing protein [Diplogelasinospora grovesii]
MLTAVDFPTLLPAAETVAPASSNSTAGLFAYETIQLTDAVLAKLTRLNLPDASLFAFSNISAPANAQKRHRIGSGSCKTSPGNQNWPAKAIWDLFNVLLGDALIETVPFASPCYSDFSNADPAKCANITRNWSNDSYIHIEDPTSINSVLFQGSTCLPPSLNVGETNCTVGGYPAYSVAISTVAQIQLAINIARNLDLRLVIKNTGHDFGAKSTGYGALSIWTHKLKDIEFFQNYSQDGYNGPALKLGAGVQAFEAYEAARDNGVTVVGGEGRTVGIAGGYVAGGGHSPLSSLYGMAADQVLSVEVVTADGRFVTASATSNPDLFWALRGGGGSTYGVVTSVVFKAFPKIPVATMTFTFATSSNVSDHTFWAGVRAFFDGFIAYTDAGNYEYFRIANQGNGNYLFDMGPWFAPNMTQSQLQDLVTPLLSQLSALGITTQPVYNEYADFYDAWWASFPLEAWGSNSVRQASRLFPRSSWRNTTALNATFDAIRSVVEDGGYVIAFNIAAAPKTGYPDNAVNPAWRETVLHCIVATLWDSATMSQAQIKAASDKLTFDWMKRWRDVSPGAGAYMSEADYIEPNFQQAFFGSVSYERLYKLKQRYDPTGLFYAQNAVGSEDWKMSETILGNLPSQNSKLCRV